ncbi:MAG: small, acid-soluble spore protein, alpha/beta type [Peptococcaceae bacterium]|nr:small, acid-soluble spore protein, alpha/beta type [Peptococcaceae bacterium]
MAKKNRDKMQEMENVKYEVAQEMGLPQTKSKKKGSR